MNCILLCAALQLATPESKVEARPGVVIVVEGIGGLNTFGVLAKTSFRQARLPHEIRDFRWSHGPGQFLKDLQDTRHLHAKAAELAKEIRALRIQDDERRIYLVGHSAGTGLILRAAESLPEACVDRMILLSSAVSPAYDLRPALRATRGEIVSYHSPMDQILLHLGTRQFGTVDRIYSASAGLHGFEVPKDLNDTDRVHYGRLVQIPWNQRMMLYGNFGQHKGPLVPTFLQLELARWLRP